MQLGRAKVRSLTTLPPPLALCCASPPCICLPLASRLSPHHAFALPVLLHPSSAVLNQVAPPIQDAQPIEIVPLAIFIFTSSAHRPHRRSRASSRSRLRHRHLLPPCRTTYSSAQPSGTTPGRTALASRNGWRSAFTSPGPCHHWFHTVAFVVESLHRCCCCTTPAMFSLRSCSATFPPRISTIQSPCCIHDYLISILYL
jgi:hypothetical protein